MNLEKNDINFKKSSKGVLTLNNAKIKGFGRASIDLSSDEITFKSLESSYTLRKYVNDIDFLIYAKGNFFLDDKIHIGVQQEQYEISCKDSELELRNFYDNLLRIKENTKSPAKILNESDKPESENKPDKNVSDDIDEEKGEVSASDEIRKFYNLMKEGIISEEEFEEKKKELLKSK